MRRIVLLFAILFNLQQATAQYTEIINSKRPGFSESPYSIGTNVYQFETGLFYSSNNSKDNAAIPSSYGGELFFRYGQFFEKLEFDLKVAYQKDEIKQIGSIITHYDPAEEFSNMHPYYTSHIKGISELTIGAKYLIYQQEYTDKSKEIRSWKRKFAFDKKRLIPSVGIYAGVNTNFLGEDFKDEGISYKAALLLQNDFSDRLVVLTNVIADKITSDLSNYSYIITMTYAINGRWSYFIENQGIFKKEYAPKFNFGTGAAYLFSKNLQIDASIRTNFFEDYSFTYAAAGVAWRLDRHSDKIISKSSPLGQISKKRKKRGNFFSRLLKKN